MEVLTPYQVGVEFKLAYIHTYILPCAHVCTCVYLSTYHLKGCLAWYVHTYVHKGQFRHDVRLG